MSGSTERTISASSRRADTGRRARRLLQPYSLALALVAAALAATLVLQQFYVGRPSLFPFFAAIAAAAWFGGTGPGYFAVAISAPLGLYFYAASQATPGMHVSDVALFVFFATCAFVGGALNSRRRETEESLLHAHRQLEAKATELEHVNAALRAEMAERGRTEATLEQTRTELSRVARLTSMAELAASIAHELNQPLAAVVTNSDTCVRWLSGPQPDIAEAQAAARRSAKEADRASQVISRVRAMVRKTLSDRSSVSVPACITEVLTLLQPAIEKHDVELCTDIAADIPTIFCDPIQIQQVLVNLITNALESLSLVFDRTRKLRVSARKSASGGIDIIIGDNGAGFSDGVIRNLFEPFVTTKADGMGMGLSICRSVVEAHNGTLEAARGSPCGAVFRISIPLEGTANAG